MAILTESELNVRLSSSNNAAKGRTIGAKEIPDSLREIIGFSAHFEKAKEVAKAFDVAPITAHLAKESRNNPVVAEKIKSKLGQAHDLALEKMLVALNVISDDKVQDLPVTKALEVARGMAEIVDRTTEKSGMILGSNVLIYAPQVRSESDYSNAIDIEKVG